MRQVCNEACRVLNRSEDFDARVKFVPIVYDPTFEKFRTDWVYQAGTWEKLGGDFNLLGIGSKANRLPSEIPADRKQGQLRLEQRFGCHPFPGAYGAATGFGGRHPADGAAMQAGGRHLFRLERHGPFAGHCCVSRGLSTMDSEGEDAEPAGRSACGVLGVQSVETAE